MSALSRSDVSSSRPARRRLVLTVLSLGLGAGGFVASRGLHPTVPAAAPQVVAEAPAALAPVEAAAPAPAAPAQPRLIRSVRTFASMQVVQVKEKPYNKIIADAAMKHQIDPALLRAVIHTESNFNARARSRVGARGLMQLMPSTAKELGVKKAKGLYDAKANIYAGAAYLSKLADRFGAENADLIIAAYNAGPGAVSKFGGIPPFPETQEYVRRVASYWGQTVASAGASALVVVGG